LRDSDYDNLILDDMSVRFLQDNIYNRVIYFFMSSVPTHKEKYFRVYTLAVI